MDFLKELQRDAIQLQFNKNQENDFYKKVSLNGIYLYDYIRMLGFPNAKEIFLEFLISLGKYRKMLGDSRTFCDAKKGIMKTIVDLQKELEK